VRPSVGDRRALDQLRLLAHLRQLAERPAEVAGERLRQRLELAVVGVLVDHERHRHVLGLRAVAAVVGKAHDRQAGDVEAVDDAALDVPGDQPGALALVRILLEPARARDRAVARLEEASADLVPHSGVFYWPRSREVKSPLDERPRSG
jgi:hypothetical protein